MSDKKLYKSNKKRMIAGVCGGFAEFFNIDVTVVRLIFIALVVLKGVGLLGYLICALVMPSSPLADFTDEEIDNLKDAKVSSESETSSESGSKNNVKSVPHTDEEFDSYFSKK